MATFLTHSSHPFAFSLNDDSMELSSGVPEADNLDVDIDLGDSVSHVGTDDLMHDEEIQDLLAHADDDEMVDDYEDQGNDEDGMMQYDPQEPQDENLYDIGLDAEGDTELLEAVIDSYDHPSVVEERGNDLDTYDDANEDTELGHEVGESAVEQVDDLELDQIEGTASAQEVHVVDHGRDQILDASIQMPETEPYFTTEGVEQVVIQEAGQDDSQNLCPTKEDQQELHFQPSKDGHATNEFTETTADILVPNDDSTSHIVESGKRHTDVNGAQRRDTKQDVEESVAASSTYTPHPPIIVCFRDSELYLFSTNDQDPATCLLEDVTLLHSSLQNLLKQCRAVLNEHIDPSDTLEMDIVELGLILNEGSSDANVFTLADIVDIFVQLSQNDGADMSTPLYLTLSTKPTFNARMEELGAAVAQGKGLSQLNPEAQVFEEYETEEHEAIQDEEQVSDLQTTEEEQEDLNAAAYVPINTGDQITVEPDIRGPEVTDQQTEQHSDINDTNAHSELIVDGAEEAELTSLPTLSKQSEEQPKQEDLLDFEDEYDETQEQQQPSGEHDSILTQTLAQDLPATAYINPEDEADPAVEMSAAEGHSPSQTNGQADDIGTLDDNAEPLEAHTTNSDEDYDDLDEDNEQEPATGDLEADKLDVVTKETDLDESTNGSAEIKLDGQNGMHKTIESELQPVITRKRSRTELEEPEEVPSKKQQV